jgi:hypothetical protein
MLPAGSLHAELPAGIAMGALNHKLLKMGEMIARNMLS